MSEHDELIKDAKRHPANLRCAGFTHSARMIERMITALESVPTPPAGTDAERLYDLRAYLAKTLDNIEEGTRGWTIGDVSAFIVSALELDDSEPSPTPPVAGQKTAAQLLQVRRDAGLTAADIPKNYCTGAGEPQPEALADLVLEHRVNRANCMCGDQLPDMAPETLAGHTADAILAAGYWREPEPRDERIEAWDAIASHPFFRDCYTTEGTLLAAMLVKLSNAPRTVATVEELDALPLGTLIEQRDGFRSLKKSTDRWHLCVDRAGSSGPEEIELPAVVLFMPAVKS